MTAEITPELAAKALRIETANVLRKVQAGKTLTHAERALVQSIADGAAPGTAAPLWAENKVALANALGVSRRTVHNWLRLRRNGPPGAASNGRYDVGDWKRWMKETGRGGGIDGDEMADELPRLNAKRLLLINERLELDNAERRGELISREEVVKEAADIATTLRGVLYGQAASICGEVMKLTELDEAVRVYNAATDRALLDITQGLKAARQRRNTESDVG